MATVTYERVGLIGDIHGEDDYLEATIDFLQGAGVEALLSTGDVVDGRGDVSRCCRLLLEAGVLTVRGNHDRWFITGQMRGLLGEATSFDLTSEERAFVESLPPTRDIATVAGPALLCHGLADNDMARFEPEDYGYSIEANETLDELTRLGRYDLVLTGHTHHRMVRNHGGMTFINAGTLKHDQEPGFTIVDFQARLVEFFSLRPGSRPTPSEPHQLRW